jgi:ABC-2 type transport system permease protein
MPIFDQGYQHWNGRLSSHAWRWLAITRHGVRVSMKNRFLRLVLLLSWLPASGLAAALCMWGLLEQKSTLIAPILPMLNFINPRILNEAQTFRVEVWTLCYHYFLLTQLFFSMVILVLVGPNLISRDLRYNAWPMYFSRPLRRIDYFVGKLGVIVAILSLVTIIPSIIAYILGLLFSLDFSIIGDTYRLLLASVFYGLIVAVSAGLFILALSALSRNSRYVALFWLGIWLVGTSVAGLLNTIHFEQQQRQAWREHGHYDSRSETEKFARELEEAKSNWRWLVSYTANLSRIEQELLGTDAAWTKLTGVLPEYAQVQLLRFYQGPQYPWQWSAGVLFGILGLSVCILHRSIKSLDKLK